MMEPRRIGPYRVLDVLGRGGMGVVYEGVDDAGEAVAIKTVRVATETSLESIRREILMLRELCHPGVVAIREDGVAPDGTPWYAMQRLRGRTLRDDLRVWFPAETRHDESTRDLKSPSQPRDEERDAERDDPKSTPPYSLSHVAALFRRICEPLAYVHGQGVIHRDLSPGNIFLLGDDEPVLFDFGLAAQFTGTDAREVLEVGGDIRGTAHYMAPEQVRGEVVDARADIYALGCILYEALTGRPPFLGENMSVLFQHLEEQPLPPSVLVPEAAPFDELVLRLLAKHPRDRIGFVEDVAAALERLGAPPLRDAAGPRPRAYTYRAELAGRDELMQRFATYTARLRERRGGCAVLLGESGAGKTRLAAEIATRAAAEGARVIASECEQLAIGEPEALRGAPLHPLRPLLRALANRCREEGPEETARLLGADGGILASYEPALAGLTGSSEPPLDRAAPSALGASATRFRLLSVLREVITRLAETEQLVLVIDDLQWADELTLAFLRSIGPALHDRMPVLLLLTVRSGEMSPAVDGALRELGAERHEVPRLDRSAIGAMVRDMLALDEDAPTLTDYVATRSEGNPLFAAEYLRIAVEEGVVQRDEAGRWRLSRRDEDSYDRLPTPGSVREIVTRHLDQLGRPARELVRAAAVLGRACDPDVLAATAGIDAHLARNGVAELIQRHVVEESDRLLRFVHDSLRELAYAELSPEARRRLHHRAALAIETRHGRDPDFAQRFAELAHHFEQAGDQVRTIAYLERAADHALDTAGYGDARAMLLRLLDLGTREVAARRARWQRRLAEASYALGDVEGLARNAERALDQLGRPFPRSRLRLGARLAAGVAQQVWMRTIRREVTRSVDPVLVEAALASAQMTTHYFFNDNSLGLVSAALSAVNLAERGGQGLAIAEIYAQLGYVAGLARLGGVARTYFVQAHATAHATRDTLGLIKTLNTEAAFAIGLGAWTEVRTAAGEALALARRIRDPQDAEDALTILCHAEFASGNLAASRELAIELRDSARARANTQHEAWGIYTEGRAALYAKDFTAAIERFETAMELLAQVRDRASLILCGGMHASALAQRGDLATARLVADTTAERIAGRVPAVFTITEGLVGLADAYLELWRRTGDDTLEGPTRRAISDLTSLGRLLPIAGVAATIRTGLYHQRRGARRRALRDLRRGLAGAERRDLPHDQAVARAALADLARG